MALLEFLNNVINSKKVYKYEEILVEIKKLMEKHLLKLNKKITEKIEDSGKILADRILKIKKANEEFKKYLVRKGKYTKPIEDIKKISEQLKDNEEKEHTVQHKVFDLEEKDRELIMMPLAKIKKLEHIGGGDEFYKLVEKKGKVLFLELTHVEGFDEQLKERLDELFELLHEEDQFLKDLHEGKLDLFYRNIKPLNENLKKQRTLIDQLSLIQRKKVWLIKTIFNAVDAELEKSNKDGEAIIYVPVKEIDKAMVDEFYTYMAKHRGLVYDVTKNLGIGFGAKALDDNHLFRSIYVALRELMSHKPSAEAAYSLLERAEEKYRLKDLTRKAIQEKAKDLHLVPRNANFRQLNMKEVMAYAAFLTYPGNESNWSIFQKVGKLKYREFRVNYLIKAFVSVLKQRNKEQQAEALVYR